jgi:RNA polymerase sigma-70 factor (ECF subfamily)
MTITIFGERLEQLRPSLNRHARTLTQNRDEALDLVQETIYKALKYSEKYREETNFGGWVYTIMRNTFINQANRKKRARFRSLDETPSLANSTRHSIDSVSVYSGNKELELLVLSLNESVRKPFVMSISGFQYDEIAEEMDIPIGTVKSRIFRAREILMQSMNI